VEANEAIEMQMKAIMALAMATCQFIVAIIGTIDNSGVNVKVMIAFICISIASFASTWGPGHGESSPEEDGSSTESLNHPERDGGREDVDEGGDETDEEGVDATMDRCQLHVSASDTVSYASHEQPLIIQLLLRNHLLPAARHDLQPLPHRSHHHPRQRPLYPHVGDRI
jgi:hypothetical protein